MPGSIPRRGPGQPSLFLRTWAETILVCDFFTADLLDGTQAYVLAVIERDCRTLDRGMPPRAPGPHPHLEPGPSAANLGEYEIHHNQHRPHRSLHGAAPLKPLPEPVNLDQYRVRRRTHAGCMINEYHLVT
jgi:hypothetical protein